MPDVSALKLFDGSRLEAIRKLIGLIGQIDTDKLNGFITWVTDLLGSLFGTPDPAAVSALALDAEEEAALEEAFPSELVTAQALNVAAIIALVKLIISIWQSLKGKPAAPPAAASAETKQAEET